MRPNAPRSPARRRKLGALQPGCNSLDPLSKAVNAARRGIDRIVGLDFSGAAAAFLLLQRLVGIRQFIGNDEGGEHQQAGFADLSNAFDKFEDAGIDVLRKTADARLLPVIAGDFVWVPIDGYQTWLIRPPSLPEPAL